jgi:hypothetical protein
VIAEQLEAGTLVKFLFRCQTGPHAVVHSSSSEALSSSLTAFSALLRHGNWTFTSALFA